MPTVSRWTLAGFCLALAACNDAPLLGPNDLDPVFGIEPEPFRPGRVFEFQAYGPIHGRWTGSLSDPASGPTRGLAVRTISSLNVGTTRYLVQSWTFDAAGDVGPVTVTLRGMVDFRAGGLVLSGMTANGANVRVHGTIATSARGTSMGGDVMFNPQPEPPGRPRIGGVWGA